MRIGIDARPLLSRNYTGIARCIYENICVWMKDYPQHEYYLFSDKKLDLPFDLPENWHLMDDSFMIDNNELCSKLCSKLWFSIKLPRMIKTLKLDAYWGPNYLLPPRVKGTRYYVTVHDLAIFKFGEISGSRNPEVFKKRIKESSNVADNVIVVSQATADDTHELLGVEKEKICISYNGGVSEKDEVLKEFNVNNVNPLLKFEEEFFLFISTIEPRKNITTIIKAFEKFVAENNSKMKLVLAGKRGWKWDSIYEAIENSIYRDQIILPGFISDDDKVYLLKNAKVFVYPSLYEGFGIPILEAFAYNLPVITTRVSSMPEVAGDATFYIDDPLDSDGLAAQMEKVITLNDNQLTILNEKMKRQLMSFSWEKNASEVMQIFEGV